MRGCISKSKIGQSLATSGSTRRVPHYPNVPFGGYKMPRLGREEYINELFAFTETKNIHIAL
jgi:acyl-CoA reductase-like NAD-dependent aldehyde dehydrogenase